MRQIEEVDVLLPENVALSKRAIYSSTLSYFLYNGTSTDADSLVSDTHRLDVPGLYVLYSEDRVYIGQSAVSVAHRLKRHIETKDWWTHFLCFGLHMMALSKTQTEIMEWLVIQAFGQQTDYQIDNQTVGNAGHICEAELLVCDRLLQWVSDEVTMIHNLSFPLFDVDTRLIKDLLYLREQRALDDSMMVSNKNSDVYDEPQRIDGVIVMTVKSIDGSVLYRVSHRYLSRIYTAFLSNFLDNELILSYGVLLRQDVIDDEASKTCLLGRLPASNWTARKHRCVRVSENIYAYVDLSSQELLSALFYFAELMNVEIVFD